MDISAILSVICEAAPFTAAAADAKTVRSDIRNEWAHCNFANWTEAKFTAAFLCIETLLKNVNFPPEEEQQIYDDLNTWRDKGLQLCFTQPVDIDTSTLLKESVDELRLSVQTLNLEKEQISTVLLNINKIQSKLEKEIGDLLEKVDNIEIQANNNYREIELLKEERSFGQLVMYITEKEKLPYVFSAPTRNRYFVGRIDEIEELKRILKVEETSNEKKVRVAAVCGLGGIGKTSLVTEYAHQMKDFYKGGVYWFSAEDDTFLDKSVNDIASKIVAVSDNSFNSNLAFILGKISITNDPCLIVLDCLDQLELSSNMMEFLSFPSHASICGHFVVITRRNPERLLNEVSVFDDQSYLQMKCFQSEEAKQFLFFRSCITCDENVDSDAEYLCEELGRLPLALEQVGAYINMLKCSFSSYLEQYKAERLRLLEQHKGRQVAPGKEAKERLAVHTTWRINMEHIKESPNGEEAVRFLNACTFFNPNEIEEELINVGKPEVEGTSYRKCVSSPLGSRQILKLLTDFSLFKYVDAHSRSVATHRLVQELVKESLDLGSKAKSFTDALRMLSYAFTKCPSPSDFVEVDEENDEEQYLAISELQKNSSQFYMWSKFCMHGHHLRRSMEDLLQSPMHSVCLDSLWFPETAKMFYECAVHSSANHKQNEAKRTLNFTYRILDWLPSNDCATIERDISNNSLFPLRIPLPKHLQAEIKQFCTPPSVVSEVLTELPGPKNVDLDKSKELQNNKQDVRSDDSCETYSSVNDSAQKWENFSSEDAKDNVTPLSPRPDCWKGYAEKALALKRSGNEVSAEIAAALAFYHNRNIFSDYSLLNDSFLDLQNRIFICDSVHDLRKAIYSHELQQDDVLKFLLLESQEYILNVATFAKPWNNCVLVGTAKSCSVSLKLDGSIDLLKCMLVNLSFHFDKGQLNCLPESFVKLLGCNFTSDGVNTDTVTTRGDFNAEKCNFEYSEGGGLSCFGKGIVVVAECSFRFNRNEGITVKRDVNLSTLETADASTFSAVDCDIHHNWLDGMLIFDCENVSLIRNNIFSNGHSGVYTSNSTPEIRENNIFDNDSWGIFSGQSSGCHISTNRVFRNKNGGISMRNRGSTKKFVPWVVEMNEIYDNGGPGFLGNINKFPIMFTKDEYLRNANKYKDNKVWNNLEREIVDHLDISVSYCSHCHMNCPLYKCEKCFTAAYCSLTCRKKHLSKHKKVCKVLREKSSYLIASLGGAVSKDVIAAIDGLKEIGPIFSSAPPRDGTKFVVKVMNVFTSDKHRGKKGERTLVLYDRSLKLSLTFSSIVMTELVKEFGVLCEKKVSEKKLFLYCQFEGKAGLRLFTNEFAEFQKW
ncbi:uncharacterized protein LOC114516561 [Dendronephthya gigantea]|uniref:uncharacterized protein LOC114516561 n=1 Tax=Dendronephthya gigantea TaxID=151771 RepID=UPI00106B6602|nr:uncharacterized protein LOC114516561 [Dendronephthya gigantea]